MSDLPVTYGALSAAVTEAVRRAIQVTTSDRTVGLRFGTIVDLNVGGAEGVDITVTGAAVTGEGARPHGILLHDVIVDGDDDPVPVCDITTGVSFDVGDRVGVLFVPPHGAYIIGGAFVAAGGDVVLDGVTGSILVFNEDGALYGRITGPRGFEVLSPNGADVRMTIFDGVPRVIFETGDPAADPNEVGQINSGIIGTGGSRFLTLGIVSPAFVDDARMSIQFNSESQDGTSVEPSVIIGREGSPTTFHVSDGRVEVVGDLRLPASNTFDGTDRSAARGWMASPGGTLKTDTVNNGPHVGTADTDEWITDVPVIAGRVYSVHLHTQVVAAIGSIWNVNLTVDGTTVDRFAQVGQGVTTIDSTVYWTATATTAVDFRVQVVRAAGMAGDTIELQGSATAKRHFAVRDVGIP